MSARGAPPANKERVEELDAWHVKRYRMRGLHRVRLYDGPGAREAKKAREKDADEWIKKLRARRP